MIKILSMIALVATIGWAKKLIQDITFLVSMLGFTFFTLLYYLLKQ